MTNYQLKLASDNPTKKLERIYGGLQISPSDNLDIQFKKVDDTYFLTIPDGVEVMDAIEIYQPSEVSYQLSVFRLTISIGKNAKATIIEKFESKTDQKIELNQEINADNGSELRIISIQNLNNQSDFTENRITNAKKSSKIHCFDFQIGSKSSNLNIRQNANSGSNINADLLCNAKNDQKFSFNIENIYSGRNGRGKILAKTAASDASTVTINGGINIKRKSGGTDAHLKQDSLLLSKNANIKAIPMLNVDTDNVKAGHGASVTNLNKENLFYLTSRGISEENARKMMVEGFMKECLDKISDLPEVKEYITKCI